MLNTERAKLTELSYISLGISEGGIPHGTTPIPWESTAHAFNMKLPNVYVSPEDIEDGALMEEIFKKEVIGCYIYTPLADYSFLEKLSHIRDLNIYKASSLKNIDFLRALTECSMLTLEGARLENLNAIIDVKKHHRSIFGIYNCVALIDCTVSDLSSFVGSGVSFSEFLVFMPKGAGERERWSVISASKRIYRELDGE